MTRSTVSLSLIDSNPYQPRRHYDPGEIESLALSIAQDGLLQPPAARYVGDRCQLVFGHRRRKAYEFLNKQHQEEPTWFATNHIFTDDDFAEMELEIVELEDEDMYRHAVTENVHRANLDPIEEARAMKQAKEDFHYTSGQVGELFGKNEATVRGTMRLLDLPDEAQVKVASGDLSQGTARKVLALQSVLKPAALTKIALSLASQPGRSEDSVNWDIHRALSEGKAKELEFSHLWPADWAPKTAISFDGRIFKHALRHTYRGPEIVNGVAPLEILLRLQEEAIQKHESMDKVAGRHTEYGPVSDLVVQLTYPPACSKCEYSGKFNGETYCALKACYENKLEIWLNSEGDRVSKETGLAVYDPGQDPADYIELEHEYEGTWFEKAKLEKAKEFNAARRARFDAKDPDLRLLPIKKSSYYNSKDWLTGSENYKVVDISVAAQKTAAAEHKRKEKEDEKQKQEREQRALRDANREASRAFVEREAIEYFTTAFSGLSNLGALQSLVNSITNLVELKGTHAEKLRMLHRKLAARALGHELDFDLTTQGPVQLAEHLQGVAKTWGVNLPDDWLEIARKYDPANIDGQDIPDDEPEDELVEEEA